jgi:hypothetical protein
MGQLVDIDPSFHVIKSTCLPPSLSLYILICSVLWKMEILSLLLPFLSYHYDNQNNNKTRRQCDEHNPESHIELLMKLKLSLEITAP